MYGLKYCIGLGVPIRMIDGSGYTSNRWYMGTSDIREVSFGVWSLVPTENRYVTFSERIYNISVRYVLGNWYYGNICTVIVELWEFSIYTFLEA